MKKYQAIVSKHNNGGCRVYNNNCCILILLLVFLSPNSTDIEKPSK